VARDQNLERGGRLRTRGEDSFQKLTVCQDARHTHRKQGVDVLKNGCLLLAFHHLSPTVFQNDR
jgi:hypothetical protein